MKRKPTFTPEQLAAYSQRMKRQRADPAFEAKRKARLAEAYVDDVTKCMIRRKIGEASKAQWKDPVIRRKRMQAIAKGLDNGMREKRQAMLAERRKNPEMEAKRIAGLRKKFAEIKNKKRAVAMANNRKRRGFDVPARLWPEYRKLIDKRGYRAREAGIALGLVRE